MKYQRKYEALGISDNIGPLRIPLVPPGVDPNDILPLIIDKIKEDRERKPPYSPLRIPKKQDPNQIQWGGKWTNN